jgi:hypothetical protein
VSKHFTIRIDLRLPTRFVRELERQARTHCLPLELYLAEEIVRLAEHPPTPTSIRFTERTMNPTEAGQTQVFTGTLTPAGSTFPGDTAFTVASNDPAVSPSVDSTGLIVSVTYPDGWTESTTTPLAFTYGASSASNPGWTLSATISPSASVVLPTGITFAQTT